MGYSTDFIGSFQLSRKLTEEEKSYIQKFSETRRMKRDVTKLMEMYKGSGGLPSTNKLSPEVIKLVTELKSLGYEVALTDTNPTFNRNRQDIYGVDGEFFVGGTGTAGQDHDYSVIDFNYPPRTQPGLWCQWTVGDDDQSIEWDGGEKFNSYTKWIEYMVMNFFIPWGITVNGEVKWEGEDSGDMGVIVITDNMVTTKRAKITYE